MNKDLYIVGSIVLLCLIVNNYLNTYEGMCLCGGPQLPGDERIRHPQQYQERVSKCGYDTKHFSSVL